jgi:hypothetical protein
MSIMSLWHGEERTRPGIDWCRLAEAMLVRSWQSSGESCLGTEKLGFVRYWQGRV